MKKAYVKVSKVCLESALRLPDGVFIEDVFIQNEDKLNGANITFILSGDRLPVKCEITQEGTKLQQVTILMKQGSYYFCDEIKAI